MIQIQRLALAAGVVGVMCMSPAVSAKAAYLNLAEFQAALAVRPGSSSVELPAQSIGRGDSFGDYNAATRTQPVATGASSFPYSDPAATGLRSFLPFPSGAAGQLSGIFACQAFTRGCLGASRTTYVLPFPVIGLSGELNYTFGSGGTADALPFFGFDRGFLQPGAASFSYNGFFGVIFEAATDRIDIEWTQLAGMEGGLVSFRLSNATAIVDAPKVAVVEPGSLSLLATGLACLVLGSGRAGRQRRSSSAMTAGSKASGV